MTETPTNIATIIIMVVAVVVMGLESTTTTATTTITTIPNTTTDNNKNNSNSNHQHSSKAIDKEEENTNQEKEVTKQYLEVTGEEEEEEEEEEEDKQKKEYEEKVETRQKKEEEKEEEEEEDTRENKENNEKEEEEEEEAKQDEEETQNRKIKEEEEKEEEEDMNQGEEKEKEQEDKGDMNVKKEEEGETQGNKEEDKKEEEEEEVGKAERCEENEKQRQIEKKEEEQVMKIKKEEEEEESTGDENEKWSHKEEEEEEMKTEKEEKGEEEEGHKMITTPKTLTGPKHLANGTEDKLQSRTGDLNHHHHLYPLPSSSSSSSLPSNHSSPSLIDSSHTHPTDHSLSSSLFSSSSSSLHTSSPSSSLPHPILLFPTSSPSIKSSHSPFPSSFSSYKSPSSLNPTPNPFPYPTSLPFPSPNIPHELSSSLNETQMPISSPPFLPIHCNSSISDPFIRSKRSVNSPSPSLPYNQPPFSRSPHSRSHFPSPSFLPVHSSSSIFYPFIKSKRSVNPPSPSFPYNQPPFSPSHSRSAPHLPFLSPSISRLTASASTPSRRPLVSPSLEVDPGLTLGNFIIDILVTTGHVDVHLVTKGLIVEGLDRVTSMLSKRFIQFEVWTDFPTFLPHLVKTEGYLSKDQFLVYGSSADTLHIIRKITTWYYVVLDNEVPIQELAESLEEGSQALLLRPSTRGAAGTWMALTLISRGDGVRRFHSVGRWSEEEGLVVHRTLFPPPSKTFRGRTLKLGVINKPRVFQEVGGTGEVEGYSSDILRLLQKHLNFTVALRWFDTFGAAYPNGSWNGVIGALHRKEIDFSPMDFTPTKESRTVIDFSDWVSENPVVITSAAPTPQVRPFLLLEVYKAEVYPVMFLFILFGGVVLWTIEMADIKIHSPSSSSSASSTVLPRISGSIYNSARTVVSQCIRSIPRPFSARVFLFHLWVIALVVDNVYQGHITAFIAMPRFTPQIDHHEQVSQRRSLTPVTERYSTTHRMIKESDTSFHSLAVIVTRLQVFQSSFLDSAAFFDGVASGKWAYIDTLSSAFGRSLDYERQGQSCRFHRSRVPMAGGLDAWPFPRNSPVHAAIDDTLKWLRSFGLLQHIKSRFYAARCRPAHGLRGREAKKMDLVIAQSAFFVLLCGYVLSVLAIIAELVYFFLRPCFWEE